MKNRFIPLVLAVSAIAMFSSCKKTEVIDPLEPGKGRVKGRLTAWLDASSLTPSAVPSGTGVTFIIDGADLDNNPDPNFNYEKVITRVSVGSNGNFNVQLPVRKTPIPVTVVFDDFEFDATVITTDDNGFQTTTVARRVFSHPDEQLMIVEGQVIIMDRKFNMENDEFSSSATIRGKVEAQFVDNVGKVAAASLSAGGANYNTGNGIAVSGGTGSGMTVNILAVDGNGAITAFSINNQGNGYTIGNIVTVTTGGGNALLEIEDIEAQLAPVPAGVVLSFITDNGDGVTFKTATDANGEYVIKVPVNVADAIQVVFADFVAQSVYYDDNTDTFVTGPKIYTRGNASVGVADDSIIESDYVYSRAN
jgi:hypothetical protein